MSNGQGSKKRCSCGYQIRGSNHEEGVHHKKGRDNEEKKRTRRYR